MVKFIIYKGLNFNFIDIKINILLKFINLNRNSNKINLSILHYDLILICTLLHTNYINLVNLLLL